MSEFTPGPWIIGEQFRGMDRYTYAVCTKDGKPIEQTLANVALQAAAPEMHEALKAVEARKCACYAVGDENFHSDRCVIPQVRAALAKAKGGAQ